MSEYAGSLVTALRECEACGRMTEIMRSWTIATYRDGGGSCCVCLDCYEAIITKVIREVKDKSSGTHAPTEATKPQPKPNPNDKPAVWDLVMDDMRARDEFGARKYGVRLQPNNGRDFLADAYQEALDLCVYLRGAIFERDSVCDHSGAHGDKSWQAPPNYLADVRAFHEKFGFRKVEGGPGFGNENLVDLRISLISEEFNELLDAVEARDIVGTSDALVDLAYVVIGAAIAWGIPFDAVWREVHASNMRKEGGARREDGKILKPEGWQPPDVEGALFGKACSRCGQRQRGQTGEYLCQDCGIPTVHDDSFDSSEVKP